MHRDPGPRKGKKGPNPLQFNSSSPLCLFLPLPTSWKVAVPGFRPVGETEARLSRLNARVGAHRVPPYAWERRKPGRRRWEAGRKSETIRKLSFTPCKRLGCLWPFCGIGATGRPPANLRATFAPGSREWCRDEAPPHPHPTVGSFTSSHRRGEGVRSSVSPFSSPLWVLGTHPIRHCPGAKIPFHTSSCG